MKQFPLVLLSLYALVACSPAPASKVPSFSVELRATSQDGMPLAGVAFAIGGHAVGVTNTNGRLAHAVQGQEGSALKVAVTCPADFEPPTQPTPLRLTRTRTIEDQAAQPLTVDVRCQKRLSDIVLIVHAEHGERLPVLVDGKPVGTTDSEGVAHVLLRRPRGDKSVQLGLDTTGRTALKPLNPSRTYQLNGRDAVVLFEPSFVVTAPFVARSSAPRRRIPVRVD